MAEEVAAGAAAPGGDMPVEGEGAAAAEITEAPTGEEENVVVEEGGEVGDGVGDTDLGCEGGDGEGRRLGGEPKGGEAEKEVMGDGGEGATVHNRESPAFIPQGVGRRIVKLGNPTEAGEAPRRVMISIGVKA